MECSEQQFLEDVKDHQIIILNDYGVRRHLQFRTTETICFSFDLITWPGHLCYTGDMGTYVFKHLKNMFEFFRDEPTKTGSLYINPMYWAEKCIAVGHHPITEYSSEKFKAYIKNRMDEYGFSQELRQKINDELLSHADNGEHEARRAFNNFLYDEFDLSSFWETNLHEYTYNFKWCCYALTWGIQRYDAIKSRSTVSNLEKNL